MNDFNISEWKKNHFLKEEVEKPLDEFAVQFKSPKLNFEIIEEEDINKAIAELTSLFSRQLTAASKMGPGKGQATLQFERQAEGIIVGLVVKAALSAQRQIKKVTGEE